MDGPLSGSDALVAAVLAAYRQALLKRMAARRMRGEAEPPLPGLDDRWLAGVRAALDRLHRSGQEFRLDLRA
ncbi:hypothetical protein [Actinoplanes siamensis]|uniref:hypothetical protein n=1 Tax=Actinoplanes siamensis TaxID=1223317 RepID=UPI00362152FC